MPELNQPLPTPQGNNTQREFRGVTLVVDPETGFLTAPEKPMCVQLTPGVKGNRFGPLSVFTANKKLEFLELLKSNFPNYSKCAQACGITRQTFKNHYDVDTAFKACVDEIIENFVDDIEDVRFKLALTSKGALDRMAILNAYRRERYNPKIEIEVKHEMSYEEAQKRSQRLGHIVDAQIIDRVKEAKKLRESNG